MQADADFAASFAPVARADARLLILGSVPGRASLKAAQYYAYPHNQFWSLVGAVIEVDLRALAYPERLSALMAHGIALWDVIAQAQRPGSLDAAIRHETHNDLAEWVKTLPQLRAIAFNGGTAARHGRRALLPLSAGLQLIDLPSSSPAYTRALADKQRAWMQLRAFTA